MNPTGKCRLCNNHRELQHSHIIPKFVSDYQKKTSATGYIRHSESINHRKQDGLKEYLFCEECEVRLNKWETPTATHIFHPCNRREPMPYQYDSWLLKFAVSISWRAMLHLQHLGQIQETKEASELVDHAMSVWHEYLLGERPHPGKFEQHIILFDKINPVKGSDILERLPGNFNRFLMRGTDINQAHSKGHPLYIFTKMGRMGILGFIGLSHPKQWQGTKIHVEGGHIGGNVTLPANFFDYLIERAEQLQMEHSKISAKQRDKISKTFYKNQKQFLESELYEAIIADIEMFGKKKTFRCSKKNRENLL